MKYEFENYTFKIKKKVSPELWRGNDFLGYFKTNKEAREYAQEYVRSLNKLKSRYSENSDECPDGIF